MLESIICDVVFIGCIELYGVFIALYLDIDVELYRALSCISCNIFDCMRYRDILMLDSIICDTMLYLLVALSCMALLVYLLYRISISMSNCIVP